jgi:hypothetical protein
MGRRPGLLPHGRPPWSAETVGRQGGWAQILKSFLIFIVPGYAEKSLEKAPIENPRSFIAAGIILLAIGGLLLYHLIAS